MTLVRATPKDAERIAELGWRTFAETFVGMSYYTKEIIDGYAVNTFAPAKIRAERSDPSLTYWMIEVEGQLAGYAKVEEHEPAACLGQDFKGLYLSRLYFDKGFQRRGLGTEAMAEIHAEARRRGHHWIWLSVWEFNTKARAFYAKHGFRKAGHWDWAYESYGRRYVDVDDVMICEVAR